MFNGSKIGFIYRVKYQRKESDKLCFSADWLSKNGIKINKNFYNAEFDAARQCYIIENDANSQIKFDPSLQELSIDMPQAGFIDTKKATGTWDYGSTGFKLAYDSNTSKSSNQD
ncbi:FimD/PapC N-terminal domain-containing protein [Escherichia coli]